MVTPIIPWDMHCPNCAWYQWSNRFMAQCHRCGYEMNICAPLMQAALKTERAWLLGEHGTAWLSTKKGKKWLGSSEGKTFAKWLKRRMV